MGEDHDRNGLFRFRETHAAASPPATCPEGAVASSNWFRRIVGVVFMRTNSKCAHQVRRPPAKLAAICSQPVQFRVRRMRRLGLRAEVTAAARCRGRASAHPGNDALCRPRVLCVGWSERLLKDGLLNVDPIAERE